MESSHSCQRSFLHIQLLLAHQGKVLVVVTAALVRILILHLTLSWLSFCKETSQVVWSSYSQLGFKDNTLAYACCVVKIGDSLRVRVSLSF